MAHPKNDIMYGNGGNDQLFGLPGADALYGGDGDDWLESGTGIAALDLAGFAFGTDVELLVDGTDVRLTVEQVTAFQLVGTDTLRIANGGVIQLRGGKFDGQVVWLSNAGNGVDFAGSGPSHTVHGGAGDDYVIGSDATHFLNGGWRR